MRIRILAVLFILFCCVFPALPVYADTAQPDSVTIDFIHANRHVIENNDFVLYAKYSVAYATPPTSDISQTFIFRLIGTDGVTELGAVTAYPYRTLGYGYGIVAFYFPAATAPAWGSAYSVRISENPAVFGGPVSWNFNVNAAYYSAETTTAGNREEMADNILLLADQLGTAWTIAMTSESDTGIVLSSYGEFYFRHSIPGIQAMAPAIFLSQVKDPDYSTSSWSTAQATTYENRYNGTYIKDGMNGIATLFNTTYSMIGSLIIIAACIVMVVLAVRFGIKPSSGVLCAFIIFLTGVIMGWVPMAIMSIVVLICAIFLAAKLITQFV